MFGNLGRPGRVAFATLALGLGMVWGARAEAGSPFGRRARGVVPTAARADLPPAPGTAAPGLGNF